MELPHTLQLPPFIHSLQITKSSAELQSFDAPERKSAFTVLLSPESSIRRPQTWKVGAEWTISHVFQFIYLNLNQYPTFSLSQISAERSGMQTATNHATDIPAQSDLKSRLESLERSLKDMETRAAAHLGRRLEGTLTSALQITNVPRSFLPSPDSLDQEKPKEEADYFSNLDISTATDTPQLEQKEEFSPTTEQQDNTMQQTSVDMEEMMFQIVAHVENELGEAIRRCEKKVDLVTEIVNEDLLSLIEDRLATRTVALEKRIEELEVHLEQQSTAAMVVVESISAAVVPAAPEEEEKEQKEEEEKEETTALLSSLAVPQSEDKEEDNKAKEEEEKVQNKTASSIPVHAMEPISRMPTPPAKAPPSKPMSRLADPSRASIAKISPSPKKRSTQQQLTPRSSQASSATIKALQEAKAKIAHKQQVRIKEEIAKQEAESSSLGSMLLRSMMMLFMLTLAVVFVAVGALSVLVLQGHIKAEDLGDFGGSLEWNFH